MNLRSFTQQFWVGKSWNWPRNWRRFKPTAFLDDGESRGSVRMMLLGGLCGQNEAHAQALTRKTSIWEEANGELQHGALLPPPPPPSNDETDSNTPDTSENTGKILKIIRRCEIIPLAASLPPYFIIFV